MNGVAQILVFDTDLNGTKELVLADNGPQHWDTLYNYGPWRAKRATFNWDGLHFLYSSLELAPPTYRFQALQDADRFFLLADYDQALTLYRQVIFDSELEWWTAERMQYIWYQRFGEDSGLPPPEPPLPNPDEYPSLAAYARYRIALHHMARGWLQDAETVLDGLVSEFGTHPSADAYVDAALLLWDSHQQSLDLSAACQRVVRYFEDNTHLLEVLGRGHGLQSHAYVPIDTCPFYGPPNNSLEPTSTAGKNGDSDAH
jgi:hypothetical protein